MENVEFRNLGLKPPSLLQLNSVHSDAEPRRKDTFESSEIRSPTFDAKAQIDLQDLDSDAEAWCPEGGAKAPSLLDHFGHFVAKDLGHSSWASAYELLWLGFCIAFSSFGCCIYSSSNTKALTLTLRFPISHILKITAITGQNAPDFPKVISGILENFEFGAKAPSLLDHSDHSDAKPR